MKNSNDKTTIACLGSLLGIILIPLIAILHGWVLTILWGWFVVPVFRVSELSIAAAIGLTITIAMFKTYEIKQQEKSPEDKLVEAAATIIVPLVVLFCGWIVHFFM